MYEKGKKEGIYKSNPFKDKSDSKLKNPDRIEYLRDICDFSKGLGVRYDFQSGINFLDVFVNNYIENLSTSIEMENMKNIHNILKLRPKIKESYRVIEDEIKSIYKDSSIEDAALKVIVKEL